MPVVHLDPTAPRKKYALLKWSRQWNKVHPHRKVLPPQGFNPEIPHVGVPARNFIEAMQRATGLPVTRKFDRPTMRKLFPPGIRAEVMSRAHEELGVHEWPAYSNRGEVLKYLRAAGIGVGAPWCASFVTWVLKKEGFKKFPPNPAYVPSWGSWAKQHHLLKPHNESKPGDLWCWNWDGGLLDHLGFCDEGIKGSTAYYLDGNVGNYGGQVTDAARPEWGIALVIDLEKLHKLGR